MRPLLVMVLLTPIACSHATGTPVPAGDGARAAPELPSSGSPPAARAPAPATAATRCPPMLSPANVIEPMSFRAFVAELASRIDALDPAMIEAELAAVAAGHALDGKDPRLVRDFARLRTIFEATRDGGFWRLRWAITNQEPSSKRIWSQWSKGGLATFEDPSATAECDEISALTSFLARKLGVDRVGLFYPTWNHTIVAWEPPPGGKSTPKRAPRVLLPTTQIFLECTDAIDVTSFSETAQKTVYPYAHAGRRGGRSAARRSPRRRRCARSEVYAHATSASPSM